MEIHPTDPELYLNRGICFYKKGLLAEAAADFHRVLEADQPHRFRRTGQGVPPPARSTAPAVPASAARPPAPAPGQRSHPNRRPCPSPRPRIISSRRVRPTTRPDGRRSRHATERRNSTDDQRRIDGPARPSRPGQSRLPADEQARRIGGDPSPRETSGTFTPAVIEDIQIKAELARYRIRGFGSLRPRKWATFDDLTFIPATLTRIPLEGYREACSTRTVLGTRFASRPIELEIPLMVTGMSYGRSRATPRRRLARGARHGGHLDDHRRRRHARARAHRIADPGLRGPPQPLRDRRAAPPPGRRHRDDDRPGGQARHRRPAAGLEGLRGDRRGSATCRPASTSARPAATPISSAPTTW